MTTSFDYLITEIESTIERAISCEHPKVKELYLHEAHGMARALSVFVGFNNESSLHKTKSHELNSRILDLMYPNVTI